MSYPVLSESSLAIMIAQWLNRVASQVQLLENVIHMHDGNGGVFHITVKDVTPKG